MNVKASAIAFVFLAAMSGAHAQSPVPSVAAAWGDMNASQQQCLDRGVAAFRRLKFTRIEAVAFSVYADFGKMQLAIRCIPEKQIYVVYGGGPGDDEKPLLAKINDVKAELDR